MRSIKWGACAAAVFLATAALSPTPATARDPRPNPLVPGEFSVDQIDYNAGRTILHDDAGVPLAEQLKGTIHLPDANRPVPVIVFIHGRHTTCRFADRIELLGEPCPEAPPVTSEVDSYRGYDYLAHNLASHGFAVVSVSANAINSYDLALLLTDSGARWRAELIAQTLDLLSRWNEAEGPREVERRLIGRLDLDRIGLMGHSRGGEGVARFATYNRERTDGPRYNVRAIFALAPTDFNEQRVVDAHFGTIVPTCDGDVYNLQGAWMYERARYLNPQRFARVQFVVEGANHNFFNTVWTSDDGRYAGADSGAIPECDPKHKRSFRLTAAEQREVGVNLMAAFFRRYVGGEQALDPLMTGETGLAPAVCERTRLSCARILGTSYVGPATERRVLLGDRMSPRLRARGLQVSRCRPDLRGNGCPTVPTRSPTQQLTVAWKRSSSLSLSVGDGNVSSFRAFTFRTGTNFAPGDRKGRSPDFQVAVVDGAGRSHAVWVRHFSDATSTPPGTSHRQLVLSGVRIPLAAFVGVDLRNVQRIEFRFGARTRTGSIQLTDVMFQERN